MVGGSRQAARSRRISAAATRQIERDAYEPAYVQLADILRERIAEGEFHAGDRLPTEAEMIRLYGLSPVTVFDLELGAWSAVALSVDDHLEQMRVQRAQQERRTRR